MRCPKCGAATFVPRNGSRYCANPDCTFIAPGHWTEADEAAWRITRRTPDEHHARSTEERE